MIGNDIVDLALARQESNWQRKGWLDKIFTSHERQCILTAPDPHPMVWLLWSMKESVYKIAVRDSGKRCFAPAKLECQITEMDGNEAEGIVSYEGKRYLTKSSCTTQYIATVSVPKNVFQDCSTALLPVQARLLQAGGLSDSFLHSGSQNYLHLPLSSYYSFFDPVIVSLPVATCLQQHEYLWKRIRQQSAAALCVSEKEIHFHKDETGAPWLSLPSAEKIPLTVSHHGRFGAFAFSLQSAVSERGRHHFYQLERNHAAV